MLVFSLIYARDQADTDLLHIGYATIYLSHVWL
jgi:hypothetical protein